MKLEKASWIAAILAIPVLFFVWYFKPEDFNSFFKSLGKLICTPFSAVFNWLTHPVTWPVWTLILIAISALAVVAMLFYFFGKVSETQPVPELLNLDPLNYRADEIFGVEWVWSYVYGKLNVNDLSAFCPKKSCMCRLTMREDHDRMRVRQGGFGADLFVPISFTCTNCGFSQQFDSNWTQLKRDVLLEIERRIRTGEFQQRMTQSKV